MRAEMSSSSKRTTIACESFHPKNNSLLYHPNIYTFLEILKKFKLTLKWQSKRPHYQQENQKEIRARKLHTYIENHINQFHNNKISRLYFVICVKQ